MPPSGKGRPLTSSEVDLLKRWIEEGANYSQHWAYTPPRKVDLKNFAPIDASNSQWSAIDTIVTAKLTSLGTRMSPEADRVTLARRVALAITGLPPTREEVDAFIADESANAYERYVDSQLQKPSYGERWARDWLDLARYADSAGYADDPPRTIWAYRDYVIRSYNDNKPFDQFTIEQIAGDLLPSPTDDQLIATAFHRNTMTNNEGGRMTNNFVMKQSLIE